MVRVSLGTRASFVASGYALQLNKRILSSESFVGIHCLKNKVAYGFGQTAEKLEIRAGGGFVFVDGKPYRNEITVVPQAGGCLVINTLDIEKYLAGLINKEMLPGWPMEALKAQAVAARSYALYQMDHRTNELYDLESSTQDQVYEGARSESPRSNRAVEETRGEVLSWKHETIKAFYHSDCGGHTESAREVWGTEYGYISPVTCPFHAKQSVRRSWRTHFSLAELERKLKNVVGLLPRGFFGISHIYAGPKDLSNRVRAVLVADASGKTVKIPANAFRNALGNTRVKSTAFSLTASAGKVNIAGEGFGHGVGMCQLGAKVLAQSGRNYRAILSYYYPLAKLERLE